MKNKGVMFEIPASDSKKGSSFMRQYSTGRLSCMVMKRVSRQPSWSRDEGRVRLPWR